jgi:hypothetical protein
LPSAAGEHVHGVPSSPSSDSWPHLCSSSPESPAPLTASSSLSTTHGRPEEEDELWRFCRLDPVVSYNPLGFSCVYAHLQETPYNY